MMKHIRSTGAARLDGPLRAATIFPIQAERTEGDPR